MAFPQQVMTLLHSTALASHEKMVPLTRLELVHVAATASKAVVSTNFTTGAGRTDRLECGRTVGWGSPLTKCNLALGKRGAQFGEAALVAFSQPML